MLLEHHGKELLRSAGIAVPGHGVASAIAAVGPLVDRFGPRVAVKALVPVGGRGKAGGVVVVDGVEAAEAAAQRLLGAMLGSHRVDQVLIEEAIPIAQELYISVTIDPGSGRPVLLESDQGGIDVESMTDDLTTTVLDVQNRPTPPAPALGQSESESGPAPTSITTRREVANAVISAFFQYEATLIEINPLVVAADGRLVALDAKVQLDESARHRRSVPDHWVDGESGTEREQLAAELGLRLIELGGDVAILANGAGLTMATVDAVANAGGRPANFLEIGGDAYTKAIPALELVLSLPGVRSLLVNFCGAFARCDVMTAGVLDAWDALQPTIPVYFSISGTGSDKARQMVRDRLGIEPLPSMQEAVSHAVGSAGLGRRS